MNDASKAGQVAYPITFGDGTPGQAAAWDDPVLGLVCDRAHPPGRPLEIALVLGTNQLALRGKSAGSKRRDDGRFEVRVRLHSLRRSDREQLAQAFAATDVGG